MYRQAVSPVWRQEMLDELMGALSDTVPGAPLLDGCKIALFTNVITPNPNNVLADFTVATFTGYAAVTIAAWTGIINASGNRRAWIASANFIAGAIALPGQIATGYVITNAGATDWFLAESFTETVPFVLPGDFLNLDLAAALALYPGGV